MKPPIVPRTASIGILGMGIMGSAIAKHLIATGWRIVGYDPKPEQQNIAREIGVDVKSSAADVVQDVEVLLSSLPSDKALNDSIDAVVATPNRSVYCVADLSTLTLECKSANLRRLEMLGIDFLDCPMSGTGAQAHNGDVAIYVSGSEDAFTFCKPLFDDFARTCLYLGEFGNGSKMKFVANLLVAIHNVAAAEAMLLGERCGLDPDVVAKTIAAGAGTSRIFELRSPLMANKTFLPATMRLDLWQKDMALIAEFAAEMDAVTPLFSQTTLLYDRANELGLGQQDTAAVYSILANQEPDPT